MAFGQLPGQSVEQAAYVTPYAYDPSIFDESVIGDFDENPRALTNWQNWSLTPYEHWQDFEVIQGLNSTWGPYYTHFKAPADVLSKDADWMQRRLVAAASVLRNTVPYGHHHVSVWEVPNTPEWTDAGYEPGYGIDCSDFTHFIYSYALGISLETGVKEQATMTSAPMHLADGSVIEVEGQVLFDVQAGYDKRWETLVEALQPGDLLYIRGDPGLENDITHVIMWMGDLAHDTNAEHQYLIMDSHGDVVTDSNGNVIPSGPALRPFEEHSYYFGSFDHVVRYVPVNPVPEPSTWALMGLGLAVVAVRMRRRRMP